MHVCLFVYMCVSVYMYCKQIPIKVTSDNKNCFLRFLLRSLSSRFSPPFVYVRTCGHGLVQFCTVWMALQCGRTCVYVAIDNLYTMYS